MQFNKLTFIGAIFATSALNAVPALAQDSDEQLEEIIISATQRGKTESEIAGSLNVLAGDKLRRAVASTIGETLKNETGVHSSSFGPGVGLPVIRGQTSRRIEVLANNTVVADASDISADHASGTEPFLVERIEILRGPAVLRYGSGAIGGVINVIDNRTHETFEEGFNGGVRVGFDTNNEERVAVGKLDIGSGNWMVHLDGVSRESDDIEIPDFALVDAGPGDGSTDGFIANTDTESESYSIGVSRIGENYSAGLSVNGIDNNYGIPPEPNPDEIVRIDLDQTVYQANLQFSNLGRTFDRLDIDLSYSDYFHQEILFEDGDIIPETIFDVDTLEARAELYHTDIGTWTGTLGIQYGDQETVAIGEEAFVPPSDTENLGLFIVEETSLGAGTLEVGLRFDRQEVFISEGGTAATFEFADGTVGTIPEDISENTLNASLSYLLPFADNQRFSVIIQRSERAASVEELASDGPHVATATYEIGDSFLDTEDSVNIELTWALAQTEGGLSLRASAFYYDYSNFIFLTDSGLAFDEEFAEANEDIGGFGVCFDVNDPTSFNGDQGAFDDSLPCLAYVEDGATFTGLEAELGYAINPANAVRFWGDFVRADTDDSGDVPRTPPGRVGASWQYQQAGWVAGVSVTHAFEQDRPGEGETETDSYTRVDASVEWGSDDYSIFLKANNLFDEEIRNATSFLRDIAPEPGRGFSLGATYNF